MSKSHRAACIFLLVCLMGLPEPLFASAAASTPITRIYPGDGSIVTSPINISARIQSQPEGLIRVRLVDRSNVTIARQLLKLEESDGAVDFMTELDFEVRDDTAEGLLTAAVLDAYNRPISLRSVLLTLKSDSEEIIQTESTVIDWLTITQPQPEDTLEGGQVFVEGRVTPITTRPIVFELITDSGGHIGSRQLAVQVAGKTIQFNIVVPYTYVNRLRDVRLVIRQTDDYYGETIILDSIPIYLLP